MFNMEMFISVRFSDHNLLKRDTKEKGHDKQNIWRSDKKT